MINLHFLHGFLGLASDWDPIQADFDAYQCIAHGIEKYMPSGETIATQYVKHEENTPKKNTTYFTSWAQNFNTTIRSNAAYEGHKNVLVGYSLGGRLALHSLRESMEWDAVILISTHPGLMNESEKQQRLQQDDMWAARFTSESWDSLLEAWNAQSVFSYKRDIFKRNEASYNRETIRRILKIFSLGLQNDCRDFIKNTHIPILWIAGEHDVKFVKIAEEMSQLSHYVKHAIIPNSGHRVPWEARGDFTKICNDFLKDLYILHT